MVQLALASIIRLLVFEESLKRFHHFVLVSIVKIQRMLQGQGHSWMHPCNSHIVVSSIHKIRGIL